VKQARVFGQVFVLAQCPARRADLALEPLKPPGSMAPRRPSRVRRLFSRIFDGFEDADVRLLERALNRWLTTLIESGRDP
jgi:hypothetical protein